MCFRLEQVVKKGEVLLEQIQSALADIAQSQLDMQNFQGTSKTLIENSAHTVPNRK